MRDEEREGERETEREQLPDENTERKDHDEKLEKKEDTV